MVRVNKRDSRQPTRAFITGFVTFSRSEITTDGRQKDERQHGLGCPALLLDATQPPYQFTKAGDLLPTTQTEHVGRKINMLVITVFGPQVVMYLCDVVVHLEELSNVIGILSTTCAPDASATIPRRQLRRDQYSLDNSSPQIDYPHFLITTTSAARRTSLLSR